MERLLMKQHCPLAFVVLAWASYLGGAVLLLALGQYPTLAAWLLAAPLAMWAYVRWFPVLSPYLGYGSVADRTTGAPVSAPLREVTLYTAVGCPFCPIIRRRLQALQAASGFELREIDVTARPDILVRKGVWSVPVVEVDGRLLVGNATSDRLMDLIVNPHSMPDGHHSRGAAAL